MITIILLIFGLNPPDIQDKIRLQTQEYLQIVAPSSLTICEDDTLILPTPTAVWHFSLKDGSLIRKFGERGEGKNRYQFISAVAWDGTHYWISDGGQLTITVYDPQQSDDKIVKIPYYLENLTYKHGILFGAGDISLNLFKGKNPRWVVPHLSVEKIRSGQALWENHDRFHTLSDKIKQLSNNYTNHFIEVEKTKEGFRYWVMNEVDPVISIYDDKNFKIVRKIPLELYHFKNGPDKFLAPPFTRIRILEWENQWSRISGFGFIGDAVVVAYNTPASTKERDKNMMFHLVSRDGAFIPDSQMAFQGHFIGAKDNRIFTLREESDEFDNPKFFIQIFNY